LACCKKTNINTDVAPAAIPAIVVNATICKPTTETAKARIDELNQGYNLCCLS
jgi:hypothetical protein